MSIQGACVGGIGYGCNQTGANCPDKLGCPPNQCPDFTIRRHDTRPPFKVAAEDCDGPLDLTDEKLVLEVNMWAKAKLKAAIDNTDTYFGFADNIGFEQVMVGDVIIMDRARLPEHMLVVAFDETNKLIQVSRGYGGTSAVAWKKGAPLRIMRAIDASATIETVLDDVLQVDGTVAQDQLIDSLLTYEWSPNDTCLPGCYWLEFKLIQMSDSISMSMMSITPSVTPSFTPSTLSSADFGCTLGSGVEWMRRFPVSGEGFLIQITDTPTAEV